MLGSPPTSYLRRLLAVYAVGAFAACLSTAAEVLFTRGAEDQSSCLAIGKAAIAGGSFQEMHFLCFVPPGDPLPRHSLQYYNVGPWRQWKHAIHVRRDWLNDRRKEERRRDYVLFAVVLLLAGLVYAFLIWLIGN